MAGEHPVKSRKLYSILWLPFIIVLLGGCVRFNPSPFVDQPYNYLVPLPEETVTFDFEQHMTFAQNIASEWDAQAELNSVARLVNCTAIESDENLSMLFRFYRPRLYWFGQRIEWLEIYLSDETPYANVRIFTSLNTSWEGPPVEPSALAIGHSTALAMARDNGGAVYEATHSACYLRVVLVENQWNFEYMEDESGVSNDVVKLCIDGATGEPCEYFYKDTIPDENNEKPTPAQPDALAE